MKANHTGSNGHYAFTDVVIVVNDNVYYRIKETDADGRFTYSKIIRLRSLAASGLRIIPNPAGSHCVLYFDKSITKTATIKLFDMNGKICRQFITHEGQAAVMLNLSDVIAGIYLCQVQAGNKVYANKLVVIR